MGVIPRGLPFSIETPKKRKSLGRDAVIQYFLLEAMETAAKLSSRRALDSVTTGPGLLLGSLRYSTYLRDTPKLAEPHIPNMPVPECIHGSDLPLED